MLLLAIDTALTIVTRAQCPANQIELDFKAECTAGNTIEAHCNPLGESANGNGSAQRFLHLLQRCDETGCTELVRARTTWVPM